MKRMYCIKNFVSYDFHELLKFVHEKGLTGLFEVHSTVTDAYFSHQKVPVLENKDIRIAELCGKYKEPTGVIRTKRIESSYCTVELKGNRATVKRYYLNKLISECDIDIHLNIVINLTYYGHGKVDKKKPYMSMSTEKIDNTISIQKYSYGEWPVNSYNSVTFNTVDKSAIVEISRSMGKDCRSLVTSTKKYNTVYEQLEDYPKFDFVQFSTGTPISMIGFGNLK